LQPHDHCTSLHDHCTATALPWTHRRYNCAGCNQPRDVEAEATKLYASAFRPACESVLWHRIVLDESHTIKNASSSQVSGSRPLAAPRSLGTLPHDTPAKNREHHLFWGRTLPMTH
jgi:hypothetical protein